MRALGPVCLALLLMPAVALSGCLLPDEPVGPNGPGSQPPNLALYNQTLAKQFHLADWKGDVLALDLVFPDGGSLDISETVDLQVNEGVNVQGTPVQPGTPDVCLFAFLGNSYRWSFQSPTGPGVRAGAASVGATVVADPDADTTSDSPQHTLLVPRGQRVGLAFALKNAATWAQAGGVWDVSLHADHAFAWRLAAESTPPAFTCATQVSDYQGGSYADFGGITTAKDRHAAWSVKGAALAGIFAASDMAYEYRLVRNQTILLAGGHADTSYLREIQGALLPPGGYEFQVVTFAGTSASLDPVLATYSTVASLLLDLPPWMLGR